MKKLWEDFKNLDDRAKAPYETKAARDADRYRREVILPLFAKTDIETKC